MITFDTNLKSASATTQYTDFDYNSMVRFGANFFCASKEGLFKIVNTASDSKAYFEPLTMDFGISNQKRLRAVYVGYEADGEITLKISTELVSAQSYVLPATTLGQHARKVVVSRALKGRYWTFQVSGTGVVFSIDDIKVLPIVRGHGFDRN